MKPDFLVLLATFLICLAIRTSYEVLKDAGKVREENKPVFLVVLTAMILLWISWFGMCPVDPRPLALSVELKEAGLVLFLAGMALALGALYQLRGVEHIDHLVTTGLFRFTRHPMYLGFILWIVGWAMYHGAMISFFVGCAGVGDIVFWAWLEDRRLLAKYGEQYREYRRQTWV